MSAELRMLIGTYTENSSSKGIYYYSLNQETGESKLLSTIMSGNPSFVKIHENKHNFYAVNAFNDGKQSVSSFLIQEFSEIKQLNQVSTNFKEKSGAGPCNILLFNKYILISNYTGGSFTLFEIDQSDKSIKPNPIQYFSYSPKSHFHCAILSPDKKYIFITDLGTDIIHRFTVGENAQSPLFDHKIIYEYKNKNQAGP